MKACIVVPHYDHLEQFRRFLPQLEAAGLPLVVVDDASPASVTKALSELLDGSSAETMLVRHDTNQGKGGAVTTGLFAARDAGFTHGLQIDADGQHDPSHIPEFLAAATEQPQHLICGEPVFDTSKSKLRYYARFITLFLSWAESMSTQIRDAMCGFRLYPLDPVTVLLERVRMGSRMAFDPELLVRCVWAGIPLHYIPVNVAYPEDGRSHFLYLRDNLLISWMHTRLLFGMVVRLPMLLGRKLAGGNP